MSRRNIRPLIIVTVTVNNDASIDGVGLHHFGAMDIPFPAFLGIVWDIQEPFPLFLDLEWFLDMTGRSFSYVMLCDLHSGLDLRFLACILRSTRSFHF